MVKIGKTEVSDVMMDMIDVTVRFEKEVKFKIQIGDGTVTGTNEEGLPYIARKMTPEEFMKNLNERACLGMRHALEELGFE